MSKLDTVRALINKAGHKETPTEEARTAALSAAQLIVRHGFKIVDANAKEEVEEVPFPADDYDIPEAFNFDDEVPLFKNEVAKGPLNCSKCGKVIRKGTVFTYETQVPFERARRTHYECRSYFTEGNTP